MNRQIYQYHPSWGYTFIPNLRLRAMHENGGYLQSSNAQGFRSSSNFSEAPTAGKHRVLLFGDSFSAGMGVSDKDCYASLLERELINTEIYNLSLPGTGTDQHYLIYRDYAKRIACDAVVIAVQVENIRRVNSRIRQFGGSDGTELLIEKPYFSCEDKTLHLHQYPPRRKPLVEAELTDEQRSGVERGGRFLYARKAINRLGAPIKNAIQKITKIQPLPEYSSEQNEQWKLMRAILVEWILDIKTPVILFPIPLYHYIEDLADPSDYRQRFAKLAIDTHATLVDPLDSLLKLSPSERRGMRFKTDIHPTASMHRQLAKSLEPGLRHILGK